VKCACTQDGNANNCTLTLCELHARELERRVVKALESDANTLVARARNDALDTVERVLIGKPVQNWSPMDHWIHENIERLRKT